MALDKDAFLPAAFRKVQKIWKGLESNGTSYKVGFLSRNRFARLGKDKKDRAYMSVSLFTFYTSEHAVLYSLVFFLDLQTLSGSLWSGVFCNNHSYIFVIQLS